MVVDENIDSTKKKCQKIVYFQGYRLWKKSKIMLNSIHPKNVISKLPAMTWKLPKGIGISLQLIKKNPQNRQFPKAIGLEKSQKKVIFFNTPK